MAKHKILFVARMYPSIKSPVPGIFIKEHAKAVSLYEEVVVITSEYSREIQSIYKIEDDMKEGIRVLRVWCHKLPIPKITYFISLWGIFSAFRILLKERWRPDIIHAHFYSAGVPAIILGKYYKIPVVISEHFSGFPRRMIKGFDKLKAIFALNRAELIISVSENLIEYIQLYGIENIFKVIPNAVDTKVFHPASERKFRTTKKLLLVASLIPIKGISYLLESLTKLKEKRNDFLLDIIGDGADKKRYEKYAYELGVQDKVNFRGLKTKEEIAQFMRNADIFILPSIWENLPCVLIEAMACGLPIIATEVGGVPEIMNKKTGIMIPSKDKEALSAAISYMLDHVQDYSKEQIASYAKRKFSLEVVGKRFDNIYKKLLHS